MGLILQKRYFVFLGRILVFLGFSVLLAAGFSSCNGSKALTKKGGQLQEAGMYSDAALFYYNALLKNPNNVDARIGLSGTAQKVLNDKLSEFSKAHALGETKKAVYAYENAAQYQKKVESLGIKLQAPDYLTDDYAEAKSMYVKQLYDQGNELLGEKNFSEADKVFQELSRLEPNYKDVGDLQNISKNEPIYISGTTLFDAHLWRKAYYQFDAICQSDPGYKDATILRNECLDKGQYPVAVLPFTNDTRQRDIEKNVQAFVLTSLSRIDDPFLKIVERDNIDAILKEQRLNLSGVVNQQSAAKAGNLLGAKAILSGTVLNYTALPGKMRVSQKNAYEGYRVKLYNKLEDKNYYETRYKPVTYHEYYNTNEVKISFQYKLVSLESGEILFSQVINKTFDSDVYYGTYDGEITALYPADKEGVVTANRERTQLINLMRASRELKSVDQLTTDSYQAIANSISTDLIHEIKSE